MQLKCDIWGFVCVSITMFSTVLYAQMHHLSCIAAVYLFATPLMYLYINGSLSLVMEKQVEDLKQQLEKQCLINRELQRQNKDLGECNPP